MSKLLSLNFIENCSHFGSLNLTVLFRPNRRQQDHICRETFSPLPWIKLSSRSKKVVSSSPMPGALLLSLHALLSVQRFLSGYSSFLQQSKEMLSRPNRDQDLFIDCRCEWKGMVVFLFGHKLPTCMVWAVYLWKTETDGKTIYDF